MSVGYRYQSWGDLTLAGSRGYVHEPLTIVTTRTRTGGSWQVREVGRYRLWWPWARPVVRELGDVRLVLMPDGEPIEGYRHQLQRDVRSGVVVAGVRNRYGVREAVGMDDARVVEVLREWEAVVALGA